MNRTPASEVEDESVTTLPPWPLNQNKVLDHEYYELCISHKINKLACISCLEEKGNLTNFFLQTEWSAF